jgi:hypothetical protein
VYEAFAAPVVSENWFSTCSVKLSVSFPRFWVNCLP